MTFRNLTLCGLATILLIGALATSATAWVDDKMPDWKGHEPGKVFEIKVYLDLASFSLAKREMIKAAFKEAYEEWNKAFGNGKVNYKFTPTTDPDKAMVKVVQDAPAEGHPADAVTSDDGTHTTSGTIRIGAALEGSADQARMKTTFLHELGHIIRLDHSTDEKDVMKEKNASATTPSTRDVKEAKASADHCVNAFVPATDFRIGVATQPAQLHLVPGSGLSLGDATDIDIDPMAGTNYGVTVVSWDDMLINVVVTVGPEADHNEVCAVTLTYAGGRTAVGHALLTFTPEGTPTDAFPHADAGNDLTVQDGESFVLDASGSYHDRSSVLMGYFWRIVDEQGNSVSGCKNSAFGVTSLPPGNYTATLYVHDWYGQRSTDSMQITVRAN